MDVFASIKEAFETCFILESVEGPRRLARFTFLGFDPQKTIRFSNKQAEIFDRQRSQRRIEKCDDPLALLANLNQPVKERPTEERYAGGLVGYASYDLIRSFEKIPRLGHKANGFPALELGLFEDGIVFDHLSGKTHYFYRGENRVGRARELVDNTASDSQVRFGKPRSNLSQEDFCEKVERAKDYIESGDVFQVVLSKRYKIPFKGSLLRFYRALRRINPSPYMYYLKFSDREIVGSSPEMLARKIGRRAESFPIAGTRPFTGDASRNKALAAELLHDEKERAEHVMLVDLARNDLGRVCEYGTVKVPEFMKVQGYSHVQHIVSRVTGELGKDASSFDLFKAVFPAGTVSGAPKVRAMEIIEELEPTARGPYAGAVGYFSANGNADFAITIRTLCAQDGFCYLQAGAGIVADSFPDREWIESERKTAALFTAMDQAQEE
ncbi:MAG TPA: anthranilate synthase component I family protein [Candidatus Bathyarchaeia archaeon]|nr:anthranilate synthase component I family protein [Candidatus Bathyarchaeia archaeon]